MKNNFNSWLKFIVYWVFGAILTIIVAIALSFIVLAINNLLVNIGLFIILIVILFNFILFFKKQKISPILSIIIIIIGLMLIIIGWSFRTETYRTIPLNKNSSQFVGSLQVDLNDQYFVNRNISSNKIGFAIASYGLGCSSNYIIEIKHDGVSNKYKVGGLWDNNQSLIYNLNSVSQDLFSSMFCGGGTGFGNRSVSKSIITKNIPLDFIVDSGAYDFIVQSTGLNKDWVKINLINYK